MLDSFIRKRLVITDPDLMLSEVGVGRVTLNQGGELKVQQALVQSTVVLYGGVWATYIIINTYKCIRTPNLVRSDFPTHSGIQCYARECDNQQSQSLLHKCVCWSQSAA